MKTLLQEFREWLSEYRLRTGRNPLYGRLTQWAVANGVNVATVPTNEPADATIARIEGLCRAAAVEPLRDYAILEAESVMELVGSVNDALAGGWRPIGGVGVRGEQVIQAIYREVELCQS